MRPVLGLGVDYQRNGARNLRRLGARLAGRLSHVSVVALLDGKEARSFQSMFPGLPVIHHLSGVAPCDSQGPHLDTLRVQDQISSQLGAVWCGEDIGTWSIGPYDIPYFAPPLFEESVADLIGERIGVVLERSSVAFLAEVPSCNFVAGRMSLGAFFHRIVERSGCGVVLDLSHVFSYALYVGRDPLQVLDSLPLDAVWEIHVAGGKISSRYDYLYIDSHDDPIIPQVEMLLIAALSRCSNLRAITYEIGTKLTDNDIEGEIGRLEHLLHAHDYVSALHPVEATA